MEPTFFETPAAWRKWLAKNHATAKEILVGFHKVGRGQKSITWPESVEEALCYGWIDGVRKRRDAETYTIRFTPRKPRSIWSATNVKHVERLVKEGRMRKAGLAAFEARTAARTGVYSFENRERAKLTPAQENELRANEAAWTYFASMPPGYQNIAIWWVVSAKKEETRAARLATLIEDCAAGRKIKSQRWA